MTQISKIAVAAGAHEIDRHKPEMRLVVKIKNKMELTLKLFLRFFTIRGLLLLVIFRKKSATKVESTWLRRRSIRNLVKVPEIRIVILIN